MWSPKGQTTHNNKIFKIRNREGAKLGEAIQKQGKTKVPTFTKSKKLTKHELISFLQLYYIASYTCWNNFSFSNHGFF